MKTESKEKGSAIGEEGNHVNTGAWSAFFKECFRLADEMEAKGIIAPNPAGLPCEKKE